MYKMGLLISDRITVVRLVPPAVKSLDTPLIFFLGGVLGDRILT